MSGETKQRISELESEIARLKAAQPTLRDQFAIAAFTFAYKEAKENETENIARLAYVFADAMMEARDEETD